MHAPELGGPGWRWGLALVLGILLLGVGPSLAARDLWTSDEIRYVEVSREIVVYPPALVPRLNGEVYAEKPPLYFWLTGLLGLVGGSFPVAGRLCSLLATGATCGFLALLTRRLVADPRAGPLAAAIYLTLPSVFERAQEALLDPLVGACALGATWTLVEAASAQRWRTWAVWVGAATLALTAASLTKGPVAFVSPLIAVPCLVLRGALPRRRSAVAGAWLACALAVGLTAVWLALAAQRAGWWYWEHLAFGQAAGRVGAETLAHNKAWHYYLGQLPVRALPWVVLAPGAALAVGGPRRGVAARALLWLGIGVLLLSSIGSKRFGYALPFLPAVGLALSAALVEGEPRGPWERRLLELPLRGVRTLAPWLLGAVALGAGVTALVAIALDAPQRAQLGGIPWLLWTGFVAGAAAVAARRLRADCAPRTGGALCLALLTGVGLSVAVGIVASARDDSEAIRGLMQQVSERLPEGAELCLFPGHLDGRANLYLGVEHCPTCSEPEGLRAVADARGWVFARGISWDAVPPELQRRFDVVERGEIGRRARPWLLLKAR